MLPPQTNGMLSTILMTLLLSTSAQRFTALVQMERALVAQADFASSIRIYIQKEEEILQKLSDLAQDFEQNSIVSSRSSLEHRLSNPISAYLTVKGLVHGAKEAEDIFMLTTQNFQDIRNKFISARHQLPTSSDMNGAASALLRLQGTYEIPAHKFVDGQSFCETTDADILAAKVMKLSVEDCIHVGMTAYNASDFYSAVLWLQLALERLDDEDVSKHTRHVEVLPYLATALWKQGNTKRALRLVEEFLEFKPDDAQILGYKEYFNNDLGETEVNSPVIPELNLFRNLYGYRAEEDFAVYERLCRGEAVWQYPKMHQLQCRYATGNGHPLLHLAPVKEEELYANPRVVFYHQLLTDYEIEVIKNLSLPRLHRSGVLSDNGSSSEESEYRTSQSSWLRDADHTAIARISSRVSAVTGLSVETVEELQVLNYGIGGHYEPHVDFFGPEFAEAINDDGNRIATFLTYLSDVASGGATVFPKLGISVWPEKGGAVYWHNLLRNGEGDQRTLHAACPVLIGYKWVANKWFRERANEFNRPCTLNNNE